ncbi:MAG: MATE family efflux transporter, partial [Paracoccaceae bacterium]
AFTITVFLTLPEPLIMAFMDPAEPQLQAILTTGVTLVAMAALFQLVDGVQVIALGLLRGVQDTRVPMIVAAVSYWVLGLPAGYVLGFVLGYGAVGVWSGLVLGLAMAAVLMMGRFWWGLVPALAAQKTSASERRL